MFSDKKKGDKHFPRIAFDNPLRRLFEPPERLIGPFVKKGHRVADLGCGPGYYTMTMADIIGPDGKVFAVDSDERCIRVVKKKANRYGYKNIESHISSAHQLNFIENNSIDFVLACGLLCSMSPIHHEACVGEIRRILKSTGIARLSVAKGSFSYVDENEWEDILTGFRVVRRSDKTGIFGDRWAVVSLK